MLEEFLDDFLAQIMPNLTHFDDEGASRMVDVGGKEISARIAIAEAFVSLNPETLKQINNKQLAKGASGMILITPATG